MPDDPASLVPCPPGKAKLRVSSGIAGLDRILGGGLTPHRLYLVEGVPGAGKTTLALQFLSASRSAGQRDASRRSTFRAGWATWSSWSGR